MNGFFDRPFSEIEMDLDRAERNHGAPVDFLALHNDPERECEKGCPFCMEEQFDLGGEGGSA